MTEDRKLTVETITVSHTMDAFRDGSKRGYLVSATVRMDPPASVEDIPILQADAALRVTVSVIQNAVCSGCITEEEARRRISDAKENFEALKSRMVQAKRRNEQ